MTTLGFALPRFYVHLVSFWFPFGFRRLRCRLQVATGNAESIARTLAAAVRAAVRALEGEAGMRVSVPKFVVLANSGEARAAAAHHAVLAGGIARGTRNLGMDFSEGGRRTTAVRQLRLRWWLRPTR